MKVGTFLILFQAFAHSCYAINNDGARELLNEDKIQDNISNEEIIEKDKKGGSVEEITTEAIEEVESSYVKEADPHPPRENIERITAQSIEKAVEDTPENVEKTPPVENVEEILEEGKEEDDGEDDFIEPQLLFNNGIPHTMIHPQQLHQALKDLETPAEKAERYWKTMHDDHKEHLILNMRAYRKAREDGDDMRSIEAVRVLLRLGKFAWNKKDKTTYFFIKHLVNEIKHVHLLGNEPEEREEVAGDIMKKWIFEEEEEKKREAVEEEKKGEAGEGEETKIDLDEEAKRETVVGKDAKLEPVVEGKDAKLDLDEEEAKRETVVGKDAKLEPVVEGMDAKLDLDEETKPETVVGKEVLDPVPPPVVAESEM